MLTIGNRLIHRRRPALLGLAAAVLLSTACGSDSVGPTQVAKSTLAGDWQGTLKGMQVTLNLQKGTEYDPHFKITLARIVGNGWITGPNLPQPLLFNVDGWPRARGDGVDFLLRVPGAEVPARFYGLFRGQLDALGALSGELVGVEHSNYGPLIEATGERQAIVFTRP